MDSKITVTAKSRTLGEVDKRAIPGISWNISLGWEGSMAFR
jgi:hypothetical protein